MLLLALIACTSAPSGFSIEVAPDHAPAIEAFAAFVPYEVSVTASDAPTPGGAGVRVALVEDLDCAECWRIDEEGRGYVVHGGDVLGLQYGLADLMELHGLRFFHPYDTFVPEELSEPDPSALGVLHEPDMTGKRGIHLHTLHPIEGLYDVWMPDENDGTERARRIVDWVVKNRGNYLQWVPLDDIVRSPSKVEPWRAHTREIVDAAHARGVEVGMGVQLYGSANLQLAYDLLDDPGTPEQNEPAMRERFELLLSDIPVDNVHLSFGEFFGEEPERFIADVDQAYGVLKEVAPQADMATLIHVGDDLQVEYNGEELIYYLLVKYADPEIVPWVHTVMFYDLFEDAGGAYHHDEFDQHRAFLFEKLEAGEPVAYFPESAYWIAFDNPIPIYLPLYMRTRWTDMARVHERVEAEGWSPLNDHVLFSSGWEWGYWQTDALTLRMNYDLPDDWRTSLDDLLAPLPSGGEVSAVVGDLADVQHAHLLEGRLAPYLASKDSIMEFGYTQDIISQPRRIEMHTVHAMEPAEREAFADDVLVRLRELDQELQGLRERATALPSEDPWVAEIADGAEVTALRAAYIRALYDAVVADARGEDAAGALSEADALLDEARAVVDRRHAALHDPDPERLLTEGTNPTIYQYGYLIRAEELCFWERERAIARNLVGDEGLTVPGCAL